MVRSWLSSRQAQTLSVVALIVLERLATRLFDVDIGFGVAGDTGLLLLWGIGHCDTMDGPLVMLAKKALEEENVNLVLPWVSTGDADEIRHAFDHAQVIRKLGPEARALADRHFLETLVRIHRAGEGAPFTGLKPAGVDLGPAVPAADRALENGSVDEVIKILVDAMRAGVQARFRAAVGRRSFDVNDVPAGRMYVEAYVPYVHYVERLWDAANGPVHGHQSEHGATSHTEHAIHQH